MNTVQAHRGPDDSGTYYSPADRIGLAHRRLSIMDLSSAGHQPMWDEQGEIAIVYNGEIYNFRELRAGMEAQGVRFRTKCDTEDLIQLYRLYGADMLDRLNGIFAFAIWDSRDRSLFVARDHLGVKPVYWSCGPEGFLFASEIKALLEWRGLDRTVDQRALQDYMTYLWCPAPRTPLKAVRKLEPGHAMIVRDGKIARHWRYYDLPYHQAIEPYSEAEATSLVRDAVRTATRRQMLSDAPVGAFLSGGLDSSSLVAFAKDEVQSGHLQCFTIDVDQKLMRGEGQTDDLPFARAMAEHLGVDLNVVSVGADMIDELDHMVYHVDEPEADLAALNTWFISKLARERGMKVLLSGTGGDDIFSGYRRHQALAMEQYWTWMPRPVRQGIGAAAGALSPRSSVGRRVRKSFEAAGFDEDERLANYFCWLDPKTAARIVGLPLRPDTDPLITALGTLAPDTDPINKMLYLEGRFFLGDHNLNYTDKMGMAASVEIRVPFLDRDLVSLATRLPPSFKQRGRTGKWVFREAMRGILPDSLIDRPKTGFGAPMRSWMRNELRPLLEEATGPSSPLAGLMDVSAIRRLAEDDLAGRIDAAYPLFAVLTIASWMRQFAGAAPVLAGVA